MNYNERLLRTIYKKMHNKAKASTSDPTAQAFWTAVELKKQGFDNPEKTFGVMIDEETN